MKMQSDEKPFFVNQIKQLQKLISIKSACDRKNYLLWFFVVFIGCASSKNTVDLTPQPMPEGGHFTGVWYSPQYGELHMIQTGNKVVGEYKKEDRFGRVQGVATGNLLEFYWTENKQLVVGHPIVTKGKGYFRYKIVPEGDHYLLGEWGLKENMTGGGPWNAVRSRSVKPELSFMNQERDETEKKETLPSLSLEPDDDGSDENEIQENENLEE